MYFQLLDLNPGVSSHIEACEYVKQGAKFVSLELEGEWDGCGEGVWEGNRAVEHLWRLWNSSLGHSFVPSPGSSATGKK